MDFKLREAVLSGNVNFLRATLANCKKANNGEGDYTICFLPQHTGKINNPESETGENIFHLSARNGKEEFFQEAIQTLPDQLVHNLLSQPNQNWRWNPLHVAVEFGYLRIVKLIIGFYNDSNSYTKFEPKPWLALDKECSTPLHRALHNNKDECALEILSVDMKIHCNMINDYRNSPLFLAVEHGCNRVALQILTNAPSYSDSAIYNYTPLHFVMNSTEEVCRLLLEKHQESIKAVDDGGYTVLHRWTNKGKLWPLEYILKNWDNIPITPELKSHLVNLIYAKDNNGDNPFHVAAKGQNIEVVTTLAKIYKEEKEKESTSSPLVEAHNFEVLPWLLPNNQGETPLGLAMTNHEPTYANDEYRRLIQGISDMKSFIEGKIELLFVAIEKGLNQAAEGILNIQHKYGWSIYPPGGQEILQASLSFSEEAAIWVAERLMPLSSSPDDVAVHTLQLALNVGAAKIVESILKKNSSALKLDSLDWATTYQKCDFLTIMAVINNCKCLRELCLEKRDTPLHHIQFETCEQYQEILKSPIILGLKNFQDVNGETPLHKAIRKRNVLLAKLLLTTDDVIRSIKDKESKTAMDLLIQACNESWEWDEMCKRIGIVPGLKMTYFQDKTNLLEVRNTLSVVAALLATITFTAGFTLPGGVKSDSTGKATLANTAAFLVFLLADTLAMCCSMLVLVCLIWSMVCDYNKSLLLIDRSVPMLMLALYSTLVAFMTGVYVVIPHKSLWVAIVILVMCGIFIISSTRRIMDKVLDKFYPALNRKYKDKTQMLEQGEATTYRRGNSSWICRNTSTRLEDSSSQQQKSE